MRLFCFFCGKSVSNEVPGDTILRACCVCPECVPDVIREDATSILSRVNMPDDPKGTP